MPSLSMCTVKQLCASHYVRVLLQRLMVLVDNVSDYVSLVLIRSLVSWPRSGPSSTLFAQDPVAALAQRHLFLLCMDLINGYSQRSEKKEILWVSSLYQLLPRENKKPGKQNKKKWLVAGKTHLAAAVLIRKQFSRPTATRSSRGAKKPWKSVIE